MGVRDRSHSGCGDDPHSNERCHPERHQCCHDFCNGIVVDLRIVLLDKDAHCTADCREHVLGSGFTCSCHIRVVRRAGETYGSDGCINE